MKVCFSKSNKFENHFYKKYCSKSIVCIVKKLVIFRWRIFIGTTHLEHVKHYHCHNENLKSVDRILLSRFLLFAKSCYKLVNNLSKFILRNICCFNVRLCFDYHLKHIKPFKLLIIKESWLFFFSLSFFKFYEYYTYQEIQKNIGSYQNEGIKEVGIISWVIPDRPSFSSWNITDNVSLNRPVFKSSYIKKGY